MAASTANILFYKSWDDQGQHPTQVKGIVSQVILVRKDDKNRKTQREVFMLHLLSDDSDVCMICRQPGFLCREVCFTIRTTCEKILETSMNYDDIIVLTCHIRKYITSSENIP